MKKVKKVLGMVFVLTIILGVNKIELGALNLDDWGSFFNTTFRKTSDENLEVMNAQNRVLVGQQNLLMELDLPKSDVFKNISQYDLYVYKGTDTLSNYEKKYTIKASDKDKYIKTYSEVKADAPGLYLNAKSASTTSYLRFTPNDEFFTGAKLNSPDDDFNFEDNTMYTFELTESGKDTYKQTHAEIINGKSIFTVKTKFLKMELENYKINVNQKAVTTLIQRNLEEVPDFKTTAGKEYINSYIDFTYKQTIYNATDATQKIETTYTKNPTDVNCNGGAGEGYPLIGPDDYICGTEVVSQDTKGILKNPDGKYVVEFGSNLSRDVKNSINIVVPQVKDGYNLIGDDVNSATDVDNVKSTTIHPAKGATTGIANYGVYELESIGYEDNFYSKDLATSGDYTAISSTDGKIFSEEWDAKKNLTLAKYDHVVRDNTGKYRLENDIDASDTKINTKTDIEGGFGTNGYRPIGTEEAYDGSPTATVTGTNPFTGEITGVNPKDSKNNKCIKNLYINDSSIANIGVINTIGNTGKVADLGIIDPEYKGNQNVGGVAGLQKGGTITDTYVGRVNESIIENIESQQKGGGIVGQVLGGTITSTKKFEGAISGMDVSGDAQPSKLPDKDGYKTFSNIKMTGINVGGIVGEAGSGTDPVVITNVYNAGDILGTIYKSGDTVAAGGIVGTASGDGSKVNISNVYNKKAIAIDKKVVGANAASGGIVGNNAITNGGNLTLQAVYNDGKISNESIVSAGIGGEFATGGIVGIVSGNGLTTITGAYNREEVNCLTSASGGIIGDIFSASTVTLNQAYNTGNTIGGKYSGGIIGRVNPASKLTINSVLNKGIPVSGAGNTGGLTGNQSEGFPKTATINNVFSVDDGEYVDENTSLSSTYGYTSIENYRINKATWWTDTLKFDNTTWNLAPGDAKVPFPDNDTLDESQDDNLGTTAREDVQLYPTLKNIDGSAEEVLEQRRNEVPQTPPQLRYQDFKVNAMTLDLSFKIITIACGDKEGQLKITDSTGKEVIVEDIKYDDVETGTYLTVPSAGKLKAGETYTVKFYADGNELERHGDAILDKDLKITMPKQIVQDGKTYAEIGDSVNVDTDTNEISSADITNPKTAANYGIYELESIGYEEANPDNIKWDANDLTLAKYDHVIRPLDGNYMLANNVDASVTKSLITADKDGGFGSDGFNSIGEKLGGDDPTGGSNFTGELSGLGDIKNTSKPENYYIKNLYINKSYGKSIPDIGLITRAVGTKTKAVKIENLGLIDPYVAAEKAVNVAGVVGSIQNGAVTNVYVADSKDDTPDFAEEDTINIKASASNVGGIVGNASQTAITSDSRFKGIVPGVDTGTEIQPNQNPDKDGYKTFSTIDIEMNNIGVAGGIVGRGADLTVNEVYNKGYISGQAGGITGVLDGSTITNAYNTGKIDGYKEAYFTGGVAYFEEAGGIAQNIWGSTTLENVYNTGEITGATAAGGIIAGGRDSTITNAYNEGHIVGAGIADSGYDKNETSAGGIAGEIFGYDDSAHAGTAFSLLINKTYNTGKIDCVVGSSKSGGIFGGTHSDHSGSPYYRGTVTLKNNLNTGDVPQGTSIGAVPAGYSAKTNNYYVKSNVKVSGAPADKEVTGGELRLDNWWKSTLKFDNNWNIAAGDAKNPVPDSDNKDESTDDNLGTIPSAKFPTIKLKSAAEEVPEQTLQKLPVPATKMDYKINAMNLNLKLKLNNPLTATKAGVPLTVEVRDATGSTLLSKTESVTNYGQVIEIENDGKLQGDTDYDVYVESDGTQLIGGYLRIHTPKLDPGKDGNTSTVADNYAYIGDNINSATDALGAVDSDKIEPNGTNKYGVYELESIGYEEANPANIKWNASDLTLAKYDHVIRPINGNYMLGNNIDASATKTLMTADNVGGFGTDGYRPIGKKLDNTEGASFTGTISGEGDISDTTKPENYYINDMYIWKNGDNKGLVSILDGGNISDLGLINPTVEGTHNIGTFAGQAINKSKLTNIYAAKTPSYSGKINGIGPSGGLVAILDNSTIESDGRFKGEIPGLDLSGDSQPSMLADKDGYKTFNTMDLRSASNPPNGYYNSTGGIVAEAMNGSTIDKVYNKGQITGLAGGIASYLDHSTISNAYNNGSIISTKSGLVDEGGGGIVLAAVLSQITNVYNTGNVFGTSEAGGIAGNITGTTIDNALNTGDIATYGTDTIDIHTTLATGGILATSRGDTSSMPIIIKNSINRGNITGNSPGGIFGDTDNSYRLNIQLTNVLNTGDVTGGDSIGHFQPPSSSPLYTATNVYYLSGYKKYLTTSQNPTSSVVFSDPNWWTNVLGISENNWNIEAGNANAPVPDSDSTDESADDKQGTVVIDNYPTVKISGSKEEIPEQKSETMPKAPIRLDYKINAMNLDIQARLGVPLTREMIVQVELHGKGDVDHPLITQTVNWTGDGQIVTLKNDGRILPDTEYDILVKAGGGVLSGGKVTIRTPKLDAGSDKDTSTTSDNYALIGDGVNAKTDVADMVGSDRIEPSGTVKYGIYELESIGYTEANSAAANWSETDLALAKYDHIIRPINGHYKIIANIEASATKNDNRVDEIGGFGTDGFTPIGHGVLSGKVVPFTGILTGLADDKAVQNFYIKNFYISRSGSLFPYDPSTGIADYLGLIAQTDGAIVHDIGMIDPAVKGNNYLGSFVGKAQNKSDLYNLYAAETHSDSAELPDYEIDGKGVVGGLVGELNNSKLRSIGTFTGTVPGAYMIGTQPNRWADKDGFKAFNTVDVRAIGGGVDKRGGGGIASRTVGSSEITNTYNKGTIGGFSGGITGTLESSSKITASYNTGTVKGLEGSGAPSYEGAGGIVYRLVNSSISEVYNTGQVEGRDNVGGIAGYGWNSSIGSAYNTGNVDIYPSGAMTKELQVGGIMATLGVGGTGTGRINISGVYNAGKVGPSTASTGYASVGGIFGGLDSTAAGVVNLSSAVNFGQVPTGDAIISISSLGSHSKCFYITGGKFNSTIVGSAVIDSNLGRTSWWTDTAGFTTNFNLGANSATPPSPDYDPYDESADDKLGTVTRGYLPTVKYAGPTNSEEIPEQMLLTFASMRTAYTPTDINNEKKKAVEKTTKKEDTHGVDVSQMQKDNNKKSAITNASEDELMNNLKRKYEEEKEIEKKEKLKNLIDFLEDKKTTDPDYLVTHKEEILKILEDLKA